MNIRTAKEEKQAQRIMKAYRKKSMAQKKAFVRDQVVAQDCAYKFIRDFAVIETLQFKGKTAPPTIVFHLPSGLWTGLALPYDVAVEMINENRSGGDDELINMVHQA